MNIPVLFCHLGQYLRGTESPYEKPGPCIQSTKDCERVAL